MKAKGKEYIDRKRHAKISEIQVGDAVVAKRQVVTNKLATIFEPTVYTVAKKTGSEVTIENPATKTQYRRNVAHVKKVPTTTTAMTLSTSQALAASQLKQSEQQQQRPQRNRTTPKRYTS